jgi:hypothetical protein
MSLAQALLTFSALIVAASLSIDGVLTGFDGARVTVFAEGARSARNLNGKKIHTTISVYFRILLQLRWLVTFSSRYPQ